MQQGPDVWRVMGASVSGAAHRRTQMPCQDAHGYQVLSGGVLALAAADGAGSASLSEVGAQTAVKAALHSLSCGALPLPDLALKQAAEAALMAVEQWAEEMQSPPRELASTLILCLVSANGAHALQIGDGACVLRIANESGSALMALTAPSHGEYLNETTFLVSPGAIETASLQHIEGMVTGAALFTDGLQNIALDAQSSTPHAPFFDPLFRFVDTAACSESAQSQLVTFLESPRLANRTDDDLTLLLAVLASQ
jgi:Protein phosphatase 2C